MRFQELFKTVEPPPGGLEKLRSRLDEEETKRFPLLMRISYAGAALVVALALLLLVSRPFTRAPEEKPFNELLARSTDPSLVRYGVKEAPEAAVSIRRENRGRMAVMEMPVESDEVIFYWVVTLSPPEDEEDPEQTS